MSRFTALRRLGTDDHELVNPLSRASVDTLLSRGLAGFGLIFAMPALVEISTAAANDSTGRQLFIGSALITTMIAIAIAALIRRGVLGLSAFFTIAFALALVTWPVTASDSPSAAAKPWLWYLIDVAVGSAVFAFPTVIGLAYAGIVPLLFGVLRLSPSGGARSLFEAVSEMAYSLVVGLAIAAVILLSRRAADRLDRSYSSALAAFEGAATAAAVVRARHATDAVLHDTVLAALLAAASGEDEPARARARAMASEALAGTSAEPAVFSGRSSIPVSEFVTVLDSLANAAEAETYWRSPRPHASNEIDGALAEAIVAASREALANAMRHAPEAARRLEFEAEEDTLLLAVADAGSGFDTTRDHAERMGVRVSIRERLSNVGVAAVIDSSSRGTTLTISIPFKPRAGQIGG